MFLQLLLRIHYSAILEAWLGKKECCGQTEMKSPPAHCVLAASHKYMSLYGLSGTLER